ncbi:helix-turn-helix domain-containing protein [uncultured Paraglaciecola sp.]|uniref:helix-turn-helix domain-containing protein n=1 Tax=uncultured Paraglaciecola sp. TaxID=1765024 RepID=UPI00261DC5E6|nr:helix-turn-helix domain-containing protein [uncultured Paraglaciecola sp.]
MSSVDMHNAMIIAQVRMKTGFSLRKLSISNGLNVAACQQALLRPYEKPEQVIAKAISIPAHQIWPSRYNCDGTRKKGLHSTKKNSIAKDLSVYTIMDAGE